jgi:hypothetical protein
MKYLPSEHKAFKSLIEDSTFDYTTFSFVKKKGWLSISNEDITDSFQFHRKDKNGLNDDGKWTVSSRYAVNIGKESIDMKTFDDVLRAFESWLTENL